MTVEMLQVTPPPRGWRFRPPSPQVVPLERPVAAADWLWKSETGHLLSLGSAHATLTTSATVATRIPRLQVVDSATHVLVSFQVPAIITASKAVEITWARGVGRSDATGTNVLISSPDLIFPPNCTVRTTTVALSAGDQWSSITLLVELL